MIKREIIEHEVEEQEPQTAEEFFTKHYVEKIDSFDDKDIKIKNDIPITKIEPTTKTKVKAQLIEDKLMTEATDAARDLYSQSAYGTIVEEGRLQLSLKEALYLLDKEKIEIYHKTKKTLTREQFVRLATKIEKRFKLTYAAYKDLRDRGYVVKTALKFGADFRVYDRGIKPGEDHAKWVVFTAHEGETLTWHEFAAKNRVAHSTKKKLLMAIIDDEGDVTYYEINWTKP